MSEKPLFRDADEEEAVYGGSQPGNAEPDGAVIMPGAAAAGGLLSGQLATSATGMGAAPAAGAAAAGYNRSAGEDRDDDGVIENDEARQARS
jgi:hypothetical protein